MSDLDLDRLGDVWREPPDPAELAELRRTAEAVRRRARWAQLIDVVAALVVAAIVVLLVARNPQADTLVVGAGAILILLVSQIRQRKLRAAELKSLTGSSEEMLDQSIERVQLSLKRSRFGAIALGPGFLLGLLVAYAADRSVADIGASAVIDPQLRTAIIVGAVFLVILGGASFVRSYRKARRELDRLLSLQEAYRIERTSFTVE